MKRVKQFKYCSTDRAVNRLDLWITIARIVQESVLNMVMTFLQVLRYKTNSVAPSPQENYTD
jgi:hypothetical protein